jgi:hypothetical protein
VAQLLLAAILEPPDVALLDNCMQDAKLEPAKALLLMAARNKHASNLHTLGTPTIMQGGSYWLPKNRAPVCS